MTTLPQTVIVIPARYGSSRLPGKPLAVIAGTTMIERVYRIATAAAAQCHRVSVVVATDDPRISDHVTAFGGQAVLTPVNCTNGSERTWAALTGLQLQPDIVVNLQGDAPLTPPWIVAALIEEMLTNHDIQIATPAVRLSELELDTLLKAKQKAAASGTFVTFDCNHNALYFSKSPIPFLRTRPAPLPVFRHIGLYAYRYAALKKYLSFAATPLETAEGLEQLRALENGMPIRVVEVDYRGRSTWSVDGPEDLKMVEEILRREGEFS